MDEALPSFRYHPDPLSTGSVETDAETPCLNCNRIRGYIYTGSVWTEKPFILEHHICPWCIADGSAAKRFGAAFNDTGSLDGISAAAREEIETRTPGFTAWQQETWLGCCDDGAAFLGLAGAKELREQFPEAIASVQKVLRDDYGLSGAELKEFLDRLSIESDPTAYIFRCLHCRKYLSYVDQG
jgi:uncharacterized protein CbrC (UPF0167 family)